ncbi:MAG: XdhC family protein [Candidatus Pelagadaptatus aseana]|uniref:XdhC family protein n=1 Tax=Candidatus Pelagadaptatus aseana TaxID=3120508 RepID=UPI0039B2D84A
MQSTQLEVLNGILSALERGAEATLISVAQTYGTSPRPVGALLAITSDQQIFGSVSGGCIEEDLIEKLIAEPPSQPYIQLYGETAEERYRFGLPCGGTMKLVVEPMVDRDEILRLIDAIERRDILVRSLDLSTGQSQLQQGCNTASAQLKDNQWINVFGPLYQLVIIGAGQTSEYLAEMALTLEFKVHICDPRPEYHRHWPVKNCLIHTEYPDDTLSKIGIDARTAIVALTHDPKLDDLALITALGSEAFYVGALGSVRTSDNRRQRLRQHFDFSEQALAQLHAPVGLDIGSKTPPEIALSVLAEVTAIKNQLAARNNN